MNPGGMDAYSPGLEPALSPVRPKCITSMMCGRCQHTPVGATTSGKRRHSSPVPLKISIYPVPKQCRHHAAKTRTPWAL